jgi:serine/threonine protein kinase
VEVQLAGYKFVRQLGTGAGSRIFLARRVEDDQKVAVKHILRDVPDGERFIAQAESEYEIASQLDHPSLRRCVALHRVRKLLQTKELLLVMEYVRGVSLDKSRPNRLDRVLTVFRQIASGLDALHEAGFVHSDMKPNNVLLGENGLVKIIDFGQSCPIGHRKERIQGTPDFIAPEQVRRLPLDQRTDVFNVGASLYWVLTDENYPTALRGVNGSGGLDIVDIENPMAPIELNDRIPLSLSNLVMQCCKENPPERPADMKQLGSRLGAIQKQWQKELHRRKDIVRRRRLDDQGPRDQLAKDAS